MTNIFVHFSVSFYCFASCIFLFIECCVCLVSFSLHRFILFSAFRFFILNLFVFNVALNATVMFCASKQEKQFIVRKKKKSQYYAHCAQEYNMAYATIKEKRKKQQTNFHSKLCAAYK